MPWVLLRDHGQTGSQHALKISKTSCGLALARGRPIMLKSLFGPFSAPELGPASILKKRNFLDRPYGAWLPPLKWRATRSPAPSQMPPVARFGLASLSSRTVTGFGLTARCFLRVGAQVGLDLATVTGFGLRLVRLVLFKSRIRFLVMEASLQEQGALVQCYRFPTASPRQPSASPSRHLINFYSSKRDDPGR